AVDGFTLKIINPNAFDVAMWTNANSPFPAGPALVVATAAIHTGDPVSVTATSNPTVAAVLSVDDIAWRQDGPTARVFAEALASDVYAVV
ncbi:hypothetical protein IL398_24145, partial [Escherichia coli]|nr:hypothetical protein [Escherichia coli]